MKNVPPKIRTVFMLVYFLVNLSLASDKGAQRIDKVKIDLDLQEVPFVFLFKEIESKTTFKIISSASAKHVQKKTSIQGENLSIKEVLDRTVRLSNMSYRQVGNTVIIKDARKTTRTNPGVIQGKVYDAANSSEALIGATVRIEGESIGGVTDVGGNYRIEGVPAGTYTLIVSYIGYRSVKIRDVKVIGNNITNLNISLETSALELEGVTIEDDIAVKYTPIRNSTEVSLVSSIKADIGVVTGISHQQITRSLDRNAADVMQRVPGINMLNNFVLVRGLSQRYTLTYINDMMAPSTEDDQRAFSFNLLPAGLLDQILVYKSPTPELRGGFAGGIVKVSTKQPGAVRRLQVNVMGQYRPGSSLTDIYSNSGASGSDWVASGVKDRLYDPRLYDTNFNFPTLERSPFALAQITRDHPAPYNLTRDRSNLDLRVRINYYDSWKLGKKGRLNNLTSVGYTSQILAINGVTNGNIIPQQTEEGALIEAPDTQGTDSLYRSQVRLSALQSFTWSINDHHQLEFTGFFNRTSEDNTNIRDDAVFASNTNSQLQRTVNYEYRLQDLVTGQLGGSHQFNAHTVNWRVGMNYSSLKSPDLQTHIFTGVDSAFTIGTHAIRGFMDRVARRGSFFSDENGIFSGLDYDVMLNGRLKLKAGAMYQQQDRAFESWYYFLDYAGNGGTFQFMNVPTPWFQLSELVNDSLVLDPETGVGSYLGRDFSEGIFRVENEYTAAYLGTELPLLDKKIQVNAGLRYESYTRRLFDQFGNELFTSLGFDYRNEGRPRGDTIAGPTFDYFLPSASINWNINPQMKLTASYGKTIDRPAYRETAPFVFYDFAANARIIGNAGLLDANIHNYDLRWEYYPSAGEFISFGLFYKDMENIIELIDVTNPSFQSGYRYFEFINSPKASVRGLEVEVRKQLGFIPWKPLKYFSIIANYALMDNRVDLLTNEEDDTSLRLQGAVDRPFVGVVPYVLNTSLYFDQPRWGTTLSLLINSIGQRIIAVAGPRVSPIYEQQRTTVDIVWQQQITDFLSLKAGVQNLFDAPFVQFRDTNMDEQFDEGVVQKVNFVGETAPRFGYDYVTREFRLGPYYSLGITFEI